MNTIVTSKEDILKNSRELIREKGWAAVSIRSVASACGVSVGSIYNYYDSKAELISATVESVWCEIFHRPQDEAVFQDVEACIPPHKTGEQQQDIAMNFPMSVSLE